MKKRYRVKHREPGLMDVIAGLFLFLIVPFFDPFDYCRWIIQEKRLLFWHDYLDDGGMHCFDTKESAEEYIKEHLSKD